MACIPVRTKGSTKCLQHKQKDVIFYCATCKTLVCPTCGISDRYCKQHDLHDISDVATEKTEEIRTFMNNVESRELPKLKLEIRSIGQKLTENSTLFHDLCKKMRVQASRCKEEIDILTSEFVSLCGRMENTNATLLRDYQKELQNIHDSLVQKTDECKHTLQKGTKIEIFDAAGDLPDLEKPIIPEVQEMETVEFKPQEVTR
ncbi:B-box type zinc finger protein ncl-1-like [Pecten maximus]|uniref:B-box type zinc finger protein ncl-1-like n=1 Tax=Pecten maximus TaxID=6579 RepID=UPI001458EBC2|nr:B-box type zinc finger protein ncl-1-like [Pecten maximus]